MWFLFFFFHFLFSHPFVLMETNQRLFALLVILPPLITFFPSFHFSFRIYTFPQTDQEILPSFPLHLLHADPLCNSSEVFIFLLLMYLRVCYFTSGSEGTNICSMCKIPERFESQSFTHKLFPSIFLSFFPQ